MNKAVCFEPIPDWFRLMEANEPRKPLPGILNIAWFWFQIGFQAGCADREETVAEWHKSQPPER